jgi:hypothetical protein
VVTFTNTSTGASAYSWDFGDFTNSSTSAPTHAYAANGSYTVTLTAINGNCTDVVSFDIVISVGLEELGLINSIILYPNPTNSDAILSFEGFETEDAEIMLMDNMGRMVLNIPYLINTGQNTVELRSSEFANGVYTLLLNTGRGSINRKLIIQK